MNDMTYAEWEAKYQPMPNYFTNDGIAYETYGDDVEYVCLQDERHVWTEMDGDNGVYLVNGFHYVNRIQYYITNVPWQEDDDICITICEYVVCNCYDPEDEDTEPDEECDLCFGEGTWTDWKD